MELGIRRAEKMEENALKGNLKEENERKEAKETFNEYCKHSLLKL